MIAIFAELQIEVYTVLELYIQIQLDVRPRSFVIVVFLSGSRIPNCIFFPFPVSWFHPFVFCSILDIHPFVACSILDIHPFAYSIFQAYAGQATA